MNEETLSKSACQPIRTVPVHYLALISKVFFHALSWENSFRLHYKIINITKKKFLIAPGESGCARHSRDVGSNSEQSVTCAFDTITESAGRSTRESVKIFLNRNTTKVREARQWNSNPWVDYGGGSSVALTIGLMSRRIE